MFSPRLPNTMTGTLLPREQFSPYPTFAKRAAWTGLAADVRKAAIAAAEPLLQPVYAPYKDENAQIGGSYEIYDLIAPSIWAPLPATRYMDFRRDGNRSRFERLHFARRNALWRLVLAECVEGEGRFLDEIVNGIWAICEETTWCVPAHSSVSRIPGSVLPDVREPVIDLFAAETGSLLSWIYYVLADHLATVSPLVPQRIAYEVERRIISPFLGREDFWWQGYGARKMNNWTPWCVSNCLSALLILELDEERRKDGFAKCVRILDKFAIVYFPDGGCDEGPSYWGRAGASLFDCLDLIFKATEGKLNYFDLPLVQEIGRFIYRAHISGRRYVNYADAPAVVSPPYDVVARYGDAIGDEKMCAQGAFIKLESGSLYDTSATPMRVLPSLFPAKPLPAPNAPLIKQAWLSGIQVMYARQNEGTDKGFFLSAKGGTNAESHNHNDIGNFIVALDGDTILCDAGVGEYTRFTFSDARYTIWTMQSSYHNLPDIGGAQQLPGGDFCANDADCELSDSLAKLKLNIQAAYPDCGLASWTRTSSLNRAAGEVTIQDEWKQTSGEEIVMNLLTPHEPKMAESGCLLGAAALCWTGGAAQVEKIGFADARMAPAWGTCLYRIRIPLGSAASGEWKLTVMRAK